MRRSVKVALATSALAVAGGLFLVGSSFADRGPMGHMGMMGGGFGPIAHEMLKTVDANNDGALTQDEINAAVNSRFTEFDADKNGSLSLTEFEALWAEITKPMAVRAFQFLDPNGDAAVSKTEIDDRFDKVVSRFDRNGDGQLSPADHRGPGGQGWWRHHRGWGDQGPDNGAAPDSGPQGNGPDDQ
jgi:Ca2+-binding EF-hand superfamily protein